MYADDEGDVRAVNVDIDLAPPDVEELVVEWLADLGATSVQRPAGSELPFRLVKRIAGGDDTITDRPVVSVHTFAETYAEASAEARRTHIRMLALQPWVRVELAGGVAWADYITSDEGPHWQYYDQTIHRFVATYQIDLRFRESNSGS